MENKEAFAIAGGILALSVAIIFLFGSVDCVDDYEYFFEGRTLHMNITYKTRLISCSAEEQENMFVINKLLDIHNPSMDVKIQNWINNSGINFSVVVD